MLGIDGGEIGKSRHSISFLIDEKLLIDAGGLVHATNMKNLLKIDTVLISHSHIDHVKDLLFWGDLIFGQRAPINVYGATDVLQVIKENLFNWKIWPDFTSIPTPERPIFKLCPYERGDSFVDAGYNIQTVEVNHTVPSNAFFVEKDGTGILYSSDTTTTDEVWEIANKRDDLKTILMEISFSNSMQAVADASKHYTPRTLTEDLKKITKDVPIYLYHIKPSARRAVMKEVRAIGDDRLQFAKNGQIITL